jgi:hypothetical protein
MKKHLMRRILVILLALLLITNINGNWSAVKVFANPQANTIAEDPPTQTLYLPLVLRNYPLVTIFGVDARGNLGKVQEAGLSWARGVSVIWEQVEAIKGVYNWNDDGLKSFLIDASQRNIQVILVVQHAPTWAQGNTPKHADQSNRQN